MKAINDAGAELGLAAWLVDELGIPAGFSDRDIIAQAIRAEARTQGMQKAATFILARALLDKAQGQRINRFWFTDQKYLDSALPNPGVYVAPTNTQQFTAREQWDSMSEAYKRANPWHEVGA